MTTEPEPPRDDAPLDPAPLDPAAQVEPTGVEAKAAPPRPPFDQRTQLACGAGFAVAVIGLLGSLFGAWSFDFSGLILIVAGLVAFGAAYVSFGRDVGSPTVAVRDLILAGGTIAAVLGILFVAEILTDSDQLDTYGGILGLVLTLGLGIAGVVLYYAATEWWSGGPLAPWTTAIASGGRPTRLVLIGAALVLIGWLGNVTIGFWFLSAGAEVITLILLAALVMRAEADQDQPLRLPIPAAFVALGLSIIGAIIAIQHTGKLLERSSVAGLDDWIFQLLYVAGVVVVIVGAGIGSAEGSRALTQGPKATPPA
jgi:hypothetical protein